MTKWNCEMSPDHVADLKKSGLSDETIKAAGIYTVPPYNIDKIVGNRPINSLLAFPYPGTDFIRYKFFPSLTDQDGHVQKYHQAKGTPPRLYVPPGFQCWQATWRVTEGEKKALAGTQRGLNVIGLGGIWNYAVKDENGQPDLIDDLKGIPWDKKLVEIIPDGDFKSKEQVAHAVYRLAAMLEDLGATVSIVVLPGGEFLVALVVEALYLVEAAQSHDERQRHDARHYVHSDFLRIVQSHPSLPGPPCPGLLAFVRLELACRSQPRASAAPVAVHLVVLGSHRFPGNNLNLAAGCLLAKRVFHDAVFQRMIADHHQPAPCAQNAD